MGKVRLAAEYAGSINVKFEVVERASVLFVALSTNERYATAELLFIA
jgi:hypothetical protein